MGSAPSAGVVGKTMPKVEVLQNFILDSSWAGQPFWMLNVLRLKDVMMYQKYVDMMSKDTLPKYGGRVIFAGYARTFIGTIEYNYVLIVEYPSPQSFLKMATSEEFEEKNQVRLAGLEEQYLIPMRPGWFRIDKPAPEPTRESMSFSPEAARSTPSGLVGGAAAQSRVGVTSATPEQGAAFAADDRLATGRLWHLNLLRFGKNEEAKASYGKYSRVMGTKTGILAQFGARSTLFTNCFKSIIGDVDFDQAVIVEYASRDSFLTMGASEDYIEIAPYRHAALEATYLLSTVPDYLDTNPVNVSVGSVVRSS